MWLIARRSFTENWLRLVATAITIALSVGLMSGTVQFVQRAQTGINGSREVEYRAADFLVSRLTSEAPGLTRNEDGRVGDDGEDGEPTDDDRDNGLFVFPREKISMSVLDGAEAVDAVSGDTVLEVALVGADGQPIQGIGGATTGLRPWITDASLNSYRLRAGRSPQAADEVVIGRRIADLGKLRVGMSTDVLLATETRKVTIVGIVTINGNGAVAAGDVVLAQTSEVQRLARFAPDEWSVLWVKVDAGVKRVVARQRLEQQLGAGYRVQTADEVRDSQLATLQAASASLAGGLSMMGLLSVVVGLFVVSNTFGTLVRQRNRQLALLAMLGAKPRQIKRLVRMEAFVLGLVSSVGGLAMSFVVAEAFTRILAKEAFDVSKVPMPFGVFNVLVAAVAGILTTQLAAKRAAKRASNVSPIDALRSSATELVPRKRGRVIAASLIAASSLGFLVPAAILPSTEGLVGAERTLVTTMFVVMGALLIVFALGILAPFLVAPLGGFIGRIGQAVSGESGRLARATIVRNPRRVSSAASSLMISVCLCATTMLIVSGVFGRFSEAGRSTLVADSVIASGRKGSGATLSRDLASRIESVPGVSAVSPLTLTSITIVAPAVNASTGSIVVAGVAEPQRFLKLQGITSEPGDGEVALSRGRLEQTQLKVGDQILVRGADGTLTLRVSASYRDESHLFADDALVSPSTMNRLDAMALTDAVLVRGGSANDLRSAIGGVANVYSRDEYVTIARETNVNGLPLIYAFLGLTLIISLFGMATTLSMNLSERTKEFGTLAAIGATKNKVRSIVYWEVATVVVLGVGVGLLESFAIVHTVHLMTASTFVRIRNPATIVGGTVLVSALLTFLMAAIPARRATNVSILEATRAS